MKWKIILLIYLFLFVLTYGINLAYLQNKYPVSADVKCREDMGMAMSISLLTPVSTVTSFFLYGFAEEGIQFVCNKYLPMEVQR